jgi:glycosyltransferase involved in cell wall biosynthesis
VSSSFLLVASFPESILNFRGPLIAALRDEGLDVHIAVPDLADANNIRQALESQGVVVHDIPLVRTGTNPIEDLRLLWNLLRLFRAVKPDCVIGYTVKPVIYGSIAAWLTSVPHRFALVTGLGYAFTDNRSNSITKIVQSLYRFSLSKVDKVFFQNPDDESLFRARRLLAETTPSVVVNGSGVDVAAFNTEPIPAGPLRFLLIARLLGDKGVREYASAAKKVKALFPDTEFGLVGWIDENPESIAQSELDGWLADGCIKFYGRLEDVRPAIAGCSVYVLPSYREGTPRTVLEAMAMGRPVITTDAPGCRETVVDEDNGFLVPVKSVDKLAKAMIRFIEEPELIAKMGARSREIAEDKYDVHKVNEVMLFEMGVPKRKEDIAEGC